MPLRSISQHPINPVRYVVVMDDAVHVYSWDSPSEPGSQGNPGSPMGIRLTRGPPTTGHEGYQAQAFSSKSMCSYHIGSGFVAEHVRAPAPSSSRLYVWPASNFDLSQHSGVAFPADEPILTAIGSAVFKILGLWAHLPLSFWIPVLGVQCRFAVSIYRGVR